MLIDEPTNHLDLAGRQQVREYLRRKNGYILVSHDRAFLDGCVDHILSINRANLELQKGNYSTWLQNKAMQDRFELEQDEKLKKEIRATAGCSGADGSVVRSGGKDQAGDQKFRPAAGSRLYRSSGG